MNFKTTIVLLLLLAMVGGYYWFVEREREPAPLDDVTASSDGGAPLFTAEQFSTEAVASLTVQRGKEQAVLAKRGSEWEQTEPVAFALNSWSVRDLIDKAAKLRYVEKLTPGSGDAPSLADLQLDQPRVVLTLKGEGDKAQTQTLKLGRKTIGGRAYVMVNDDPAVYVVQHDLHEQVLDKQVSEWRKKSLTMPSEGQAGMVKLTRDGQAIELVKNDGQWALGSPLSGRASSKAIGDLLSAAGGIWLTKFVADLPQDLSIFGLDQPAKVLTVQQPAPPPAEGQEPGKPTTTKLLIGAPTDLKRDHYFAALLRDDEPVKVVFTITRSDAEKFDKSADDLRDKRVTVVKAADVNELKLARGAEVLHLQRGASGWSFADPGPGFKADSGQVSQLVEKLAAVEASSYRAEAMTGDPAATVTLTATGRPEPDALRLYALSGESPSYVCYRNNETIGYVVSADKLEGAFAPPIALREREVLNLPKEKLASLTITQSDGTSLKLAQAEGKWSLEGFAGVEQSAVDALAGQLQPLRAEGWTTEAIAADASLLRATISSSEGQTLELRVDPAGKRAQLSGVDAVFTVSQTLVDALSAEFRPRTVIAAASDDIEKVTVTRGGAVTQVKRSGLDYVDAESNTLDAAAAAGLFDALGGLRAVRYVAAPATAAEPLLSLEITVKDGQPQRLDVFEGELGRSGERWFTLEAEDYKRLTAELKRK